MDGARAVEKMRLRMWIMSPHGAPRIKPALIVALLFLLCSDFRIQFVSAQATRASPVFRPALAQIQSQARIPILLPSKLPSAISERAIKRAWGEVRKDGYFNPLYFSEDASNATFAAGFGGSTDIFDPKDVPDTRQVKLSAGRTGMFRPFPVAAPAHRQTCGGNRTA